MIRTPTGRRNRPCPGTIYGHIGPNRGMSHVRGTVNGTVMLRGTCRPRDIMIMIAAGMELAAMIGPMALIVLTTGTDAALVMLTAGTDAALIMLSAITVSVAVVAGAVLGT